MTTKGSCSGGETPHQVSGQYEFRDVVYTDGFADVHKLLEYDDYRHDDIILTTYPKSGELFCHIIRNFPRKSSPVTIDSLYPEAERWRKATTNVEHKLDISWTRKIRLITPPWPITA